MSKFILGLNIALQTIENALPILFGRKFPPAFAIAGVYKPQGFLGDNSSNQKSIKDIIQDHILWAVPRNRRTVEKRLKRKYGSPEYVLKLLAPKTNLRVCSSCGHDHEVGVLCPNCYKKVAMETQEMQDQIQKELGLDPVNQEVIVLYDGEKGDQNAETWKGKRIVEMKKSRPLWFSKNLIEKTTQPPATTKEVKPTDLS